MSRKRSKTRDRVLCVRFSSHEYNKLVEGACRSMVPAISHYARAVLVSTPTPGQLDAERQIMIKLDKLAEAIDRSPPGPARDKALDAIVDAKLEFMNSRKRHDAY